MLPFQCNDNEMLQILNYIFKLFQFIGTHGTILLDNNL
jgi:hypothetical protein